MKFGVFNIPYSRAYSAGAITAREVIDWDLKITKWADEYGWDEAFFAEHFTLGDEPSPSPEVMIAAAAQLTSTIKLGAAAHLVAYHNPIALAHRIMWLDHMTGGRYIAGVAPGAFPSDAQLFNTGKNNPEMMVEALDIMEAIWTRQGPFKISGEYWTVDMPGYSEETKGPHLTPLQDSIPVLMTGVQPNSPTLALAGERGYSPMSQQVHESVLLTHWNTYSQAALNVGRVPQRRDWRICRDVFVADTDEEARAAYLNGAMGDLWGNYNLPLFKRIGIASYVTGDTIDLNNLTAEWMVDNFHFVGSPESVAAKIDNLYNAVGGFGSLVSFAHDYRENPESYRRSFELIGSEVAPRLTHLDLA